MPNQRQNNLDRMKENNAFDVIVVGGGVNGIGVYRDLALQGLRVLLVERNDFSAGCSAAPSRMIHGGLRYLENGEFGLVKESLRERDALLRNAPHMVRPLPTLIPITSTFSGLLNAAASLLGKTGKPSNRGAVPIKLGLALYDWVTRKNRALPKHHFKSRQMTRAGWPDLTPLVTRSAVYYDAWISHPERLCLEMLLDTERDAPDCIALNYCEIRNEGGAFIVSDTCSDAQFEVQAKLIVNATGAWLDDTAKALGSKGNARMVSGTKGSHLIIDNPALMSALGGHMVYFENVDGRVCIVFPYQGKVLAGSTDIRVDKPRRVRCEPEETDYILGSLRLVFPEIEVKVEDVVFSYAGIRPLPQSDESFTGRISRGHDVRRLAGATPQLAMIGGKWTTFRAFAEQTADMALAELGRPRLVSTLDMPIGGGAGFEGEGEDLIGKLVRDTGISMERAKHLVDRYGGKAAELAPFCSDHADDPRPIGADYTEAEIIWLLRKEFTLTLSDLVLRRTSLAITGELSLEIIDRLAAIVQSERGLSDQDISQQHTALIDELDRFHGVPLQTLKDRNTQRSIQCA